MIYSKVIIGVECGYSLFAETPVTFSLYGVDTQALGTSCPSTVFARRNRRVLRLTSISQLSSGAVIGRFFFPLGFTMLRLTS